jgi:proteasome lid subunit RPN8/RPN11
MSQDSWKVIIKSNTYKKILLHCTRFANNSIPKSQWKEVYGFLTGKIEHDNVICNDAVPMTHGGAIEVEFSERNYIEAAELNEKLLDKDEFIVGWYHSHPGLNIFLSSTDIRNHIGYQATNPKAIALVFDHTSLRGGFLGFKIFLLDNPHDENTGYHIVDWIIPDLDEKVFAESIFELSQRMSAGKPGIEEYGEFQGAELPKKAPQQEIDDSKKSEESVELIVAEEPEECPTAQKNLIKSLDLEKNKQYQEAIDYAMDAGKEFEENNLVGRASDAYLQVGRYLYSLWETTQERRYQIFSHMREVEEEDINSFEKLARSLNRVSKEKKSEDIGLILEIKNINGEMVKVQDEKIQIANILMEAAQICELRLENPSNDLSTKSKSELCLKAASLLSTAIIFARNVKKQKGLARQIFNFNDLSYDINRFLIKNQDLHARMAENQKNFGNAKRIYKGASLIATHAAESLEGDEIKSNLVGLANYYLGRMCLSIGEEMKFEKKFLCKSAPYYKKAENFFVRAKDSFPDHAVSDIHNANIFLEEVKSLYQVAKEDCQSKNLEIEDLPEKLKVKTKILQEIPSPMFYP